MDLSGVRGDTLWANTPCDRKSRSKRYRLDRLLKIVFDTFDRPIPFMGTGRIF